MGAPAAACGRDRLHPFGVEFGQARRFDPALCLQLAATMASAGGPRQIGSRPPAAMRWKVRASAALRNIWPTFSGGRKTRLTCSDSLSRGRSRSGAITSCTGWPSSGLRAGVREKLFPREAAESAVGGVPAGHGPGHGDRVDARGGHCRVALLVQPLRRKAARRPTGGVQPFEPAAARVAVDEEEIAAGAAHHRFDDAQHGVGGDGGIGCRAAFLGYAHAGLRGQRMAGGDDAVAAVDDRTRLVAVRRISDRGTSVRSANRLTRPMAS